MKNIFSWIEVQLEWLKSFFSEENGKASSRRLLGSAIVATFIYTYIRVSLTLNRLQDISEMWLIMLSAILGFNVADWLIKLKIMKTSGEVKKETENNGNA
ncbi:MAG TPA: hypothetical protein VHO03_17315 [Ignavibacteriales bacterium]|nr:hypothetical protein [Ignavibacteriales bacterium]